MLPTSSPSINTSISAPKLAAIAAALVAVSVVMSVAAISLVTKKSGPVTMDSARPKAEASALSLEQVNAILKTATKGQAIAYAVFHGPDGLTGALVGDANSRSPGDQERVVSWINPQGYVMTGSLISPTGASLTLEAIRAFGSRGIRVAPAGLGSNTSVTPQGIPDVADQQGSAAPTNQNAISTVSTLPKGLTEIQQQTQSSGAPELTVFFDPNCVFCHVMWQNLNDASLAGKVHIRWVPVGILRADSMGRAASIIQGGLPAMQSNETAFNGGSETGAAPISKDLGALHVAQSNTQKFIAWSHTNGFSPSTPTLVWTAKDGKLHAIVGAQTDAWVHDELGIR
jgi:thiol:disulfide interchange protein DsbG